MGAKADCPEITIVGADSPSGAFTRTEEDVLAYLDLNWHKSEQLVEATHHNRNDSERIS